jgi:hypothetical protein
MFGITRVEAGTEEAQSWSFGGVAEKGAFSFSYRYRSPFLIL